ncbi:MAG TPA: hypothetical protein VF205_10430 [Nitrospiraceae bacterium]
MKTTVEIPDTLMKEARKLASRQRTTLRVLIVEGLRRVLTERRSLAGFRLRKATYQGIRVRIMQNWRVIFEYDIRFNSLPPVTGLKTTVTNIIFGFSYDFKP